MTYEEVGTTMEIRLLQQKILAPTSVIVVVILKAQWVSQTECSLETFQRFEPDFLVLPTGIVTKHETLLEATRPRNDVPVDSTLLLC